MGRRYGGNYMDLKGIIKNNYYLFKICSLFRYTIPGILLGKRWDVLETKRKFKNTFEREINLNNPKTLNEKLQWLKLNVREDFHTDCADKYLARRIWENYGKEGLIPLLYQTYNWRDITIEVIPEEPCIIKCSSGSACYQIIRNKNNINIKQLREQCRIWLACNFYYRTQEWQYKNTKPSILIEKLLLDKHGRIPNDYKLHFLNGNLEFVYCSVDREGKNYRIIYDKDWKRMEMEWVPKGDHKGITGPNIDKPDSFAKMVEIGSEIAKKFQYVRVDFYDIEGKLYYGEITLHHGSGFDTFIPEKYDLLYGEKLIIG